jgi:hypothetical protein
VMTRERLPSVKWSLRVLPRMLVTAPFCEQERARAHWLECACKSVHRPRLCRHSVGSQKSRCTCTLVGVCVQERTQALDFVAIYGQERAHAHIGWSVRAWACTLVEVCVLVHECPMALGQPCSPPVQCHRYEEPAASSLSFIDRAGKSFIII